MLRVSIALIVALFCFSFRVLAYEVTVSCESPVGPRVDYGPGPGSETDENVLEMSEDSFTAVEPLFILDTELRSEMKVIWGSTRPKGVSPDIIPPVKAQNYPIVFWSHERIVAIDNGSSSVWVFSLYPQLEYGIFSRQKLGGILRATATGSIMHSKCKFSDAIEPDL